MECRRNRRGFTRAAGFQAILVRKRIRGGCDERALLCCCGARCGADVNESAPVKRLADFD